MTTTEAGIVLGAVGLVGLILLSILRTGSEVKKMGTTLDSAILDSRKWREGEALRADKRAEKVIEAIQHTGSIHERA